ncbi:unnamed protein product [Plasmodium vivax]|uniref:(malaria parasite P. vivax) hypothetical protein n=1 Tax=Plasmodium vivax TaxID=5855 RepID=A0A8S4HN44_PLAVI|nr:unnamed protein product [Plasmodium vivax]
MHKRAYSESGALSKIAQRGERERGLPSESNGLPSQTNGLPSQTNGLPSQTNGLPSQTNGLPSQTNGLPTESNDLHSDPNARTHKLESVVVRIKKLEESERPTLHADPKDKTVLYFEKDFEIEQYHFDMVFGTNDDNETVFREIGGHTIVKNVCRGFKETIIAYGQTGSGKTYTLFGSNGELGIVHHFLHHLYRVKCGGVRKKTIYLSLYEVVGDKLIDLMTNVSERNAQFYTQEFFLKTVRHSYKVVKIASFEMAKKLIDAACLMRHVEATSQNRRSSRSHAIIQLFVNISDLTHHDGMETTRDYYGVLTFVDLVGCEREEFNTQASQNRSEQTSAKFLNSSLTSLNKMLRKMQMGNLDESDKRQSVLCKVLFNYIKKTCGVCLIFCFNPRQCQKSLTSSTLIMASDCRKIKSKRKQLIYVKTENRDHFFKGMTHGGSPQPRRSEGGSSKETSPGKGAPSKGTAIGTPITTANYNATRSDAMMVVVHPDAHILTLRKGQEKQEALKQLVSELIGIKEEEEKEREKEMRQLQSDVDRLTKECSHWKRQAHHYHHKLRELHRNYKNIRELLYNTLHSGGNDISVGTFGASSSCLSLGQPDEDISSPPLGGDIPIKENEPVRKETLFWGEKEISERKEPLRKGDIQTGGITSNEKKISSVLSSQASNRSGLSKGEGSFNGPNQRRREENSGGYSHHLQNGGHLEANASVRRRDNKEGGTQRQGSYVTVGASSPTYTQQGYNQEDDLHQYADARNYERAFIKGNSSAKVPTGGGTQVEPKRDVRNAHQITIDSLTNKIRNRILKSRSLSTAG